MTRSRKGRISHEGPNAEQHECLPQAEWLPYHCESSGKIARILSRDYRGSAKCELRRYLRPEPIASFVFEDPILPRTLYDRQRATNSANDSLPNIPEKEFSFEHGVSCGVPLSPYSSANNLEEQLFRMPAPILFPAGFQLSIERAGRR
jgi:hypothetical protein